MDSRYPITILSTRNLGNHVLEKALQKQWHVEVCNFIETEGILQEEDADTFAGIMDNGSHPAMLIFTSMNGVKWLKKGLEQFGRSITPGATALCVGKKTAAKASDQLKALPLLIAENGADLLELIKKHIPAQTQLLYPCSKSRLDTLPEGLRNAGFCLHELPVYNTLPVPRKIEGDFNFVLFFSPSAVEAFFEMNHWRSGVIGVCIGATTAEALRKKGVMDILVTETPDEMKMLDAIQRFINKG